MKKIFFSLAEAMKKLFSEGRKSSKFFLSHSLNECRFRYGIGLTSHKMADGENDFMEHQAEKFTSLIIKNAFWILN